MSGRVNGGKQMDKSYYAQLENKIGLYDTRKLRGETHGICAPHSTSLKKL